MSKYFEGYLQLRDCSQEVLDFVDEKMQEDNVTVAKRTERKNGVDMSVSSNSFLMKLATLLPRKFSGEMKKTAKLFSRDRQTGKEIHRMTVYFRELAFSVGDVIDYRGDQVKIISLGDKITGKNVKTGEKLFLRDL